MNNKLETIRQACIKANPEIVELKFGCEISLLKRRVIYLTSQGHPHKDSISVIYCTNNDILSTEVSEKWLEEIEIIGRPIRLADVLLALQEYDKRENLDENKANSLAVDVFGDFGLTKMDVDLNYSIEILGNWNLLKDDLTQQSEETINFLYDLVK